MATFNKVASFRRATFFQEAIFRKLRNKRDSQYQDAPVLSFQSSIFVNPEKIRFDDFDLGNVSFVYTDVSRINLGERVRWETSKKPIDERSADEGEVPYEVVATVYRRLRQNFDSKSRYVEGGRFFIAEMEVKRKNVKIKNRMLKWLRTNVFSALAWYKYFSNYGESYIRIILWAIFTPPLASFLTTLTTIPLNLSQPITVSLDADLIIESLTQFFTNFQEHLRNYVLAFFQLKTDNMKELTIRILSLLLLGQLYIALRRQFERKYKI